MMQDSLLAGVVPLDKRVQGNSSIQLAHLFKLMDRSADSTHVRPISIAPSPVAPNCQCHTTKALLTTIIRATEKHPDPSHEHQRRVQSEHLQSELPNPEQTHPQIVTRRPSNNVICSHNPYFRNIKYSLRP